VIETLELRKSEIDDIPDSVRPLNIEQRTHRVFAQGHLPRQMLRFGLVGGLNTLVDLLILNGLLWLFPTTSSLMLLAYNALAYSLGAVNSFLLNKYWTFGHRQKTTRRELVRFTLTTLCGIGWSNSILWLASTVLHPFLVNPTVWANASKVLAIGGTALISYLGMRLWVFVSNAQKDQTRFPAQVPAVGAQLCSLTKYSGNTVGADLSQPTADLSANACPTLLSTSIIAPTGCDEHQVLLPAERRDATGERELCLANEDGDKAETLHSLSVVLPAYNEEHIIGATLEQVLNVLAAWVRDFEVIVVNDGSTDRTGEILAAITEAEPRVRVVTHECNQGYGSALADGFAAATKELTFFMDSDGQFDIRDLARLLPFIDEYDAVIGYRLQRQDTWVRKLNALGWNVLIRTVLGVHVRDIDCAFKLLRTDFLRQHPLETRGAMINAELLYKLKRAGCTYREVGVHHLPRQGGRATGANLRVIARAFRELFIFARNWRREERAHARQLLISEQHPF